MFEKEAQDYAIVSLPDGYTKIEHQRRVDFQKGAEFGYNKANEWHYPSKGELPEEDTTEKEKLYLLLFGLDDSDCMTGVFSHGRFWCIDSGWLETNEVIAWKEIVLPKEIEAE